jgi:hypothetical protein
VGFGRPFFFFLLFFFCFLFFSSFVGRSTFEMQREPTGEAIRMKALQDEQKRRMDLEAKQRFVDFGFFSFWFEFRFPERRRSSDWKRCRQRLSLDVG